MSFKFNFFPDNDIASEKDSSSGGEGDKSYVELNPCKEILIKDFHSSLVSKLKNESSGKRTAVTEVSVSKAQSLTCVKLSELTEIEEMFVKEEDKKVQSILKSSTDLVTGVYEGGFKTWECTFDLISHIQDNFETVILKTASECNKRSLKILDMGCGSGLVGLAVLKLAEMYGVEISLDFQDYNDEVINYVTIPNTLLNFKDEMAARCRFFAGDWDNFRNLISETCKDSEGTANNPTDAEIEKYDIIFSSETIYNLDYFPKILRLIKSCLRKNRGGGGGLYLAAKTFYFGVGGGTKAFLSMVNEDELLEAKVVHVIKQGVQREIIHCQLQNK